MALQAGDTFGGKLRLERRIGEGAAGMVWAAEHLAMGSRVAVKVLDAAHLREPRVVERFLLEARSVSQIHHPNIVTIFDFDTTPDGLPYIVMELLVGENLGQRMTRLQRLATGELCTIVDQCAAALSVAHQRRIIHRDIKPANIHLVATREGLSVKLLDFGIAKHLEADLSLTSTNTLLGSPRYMSPEQLDDPRDIDQRADLWSLAVVVYECLLGRPPFVGPTFFALREAMAKGPPVPPRHLRPELPAAVDAWVRTAFAPDIDARFSSAEQLAEALRIATRGFRDAASGRAGRDLAIGPTAPQRAVADAAPFGTVVMNQVAEADLGSTIAIDQQPEALASESPLASTIVDPSLSAIPPSGPRPHAAPLAQPPSSAPPSHPAPSIPPPPMRSMGGPASLPTVLLALGLALTLAVVAVLAWVLVG